MRHPMAAAALLGTFAASALGSGLPLPSAQSWKLDREKALISNVELKAAVLWSAGKEMLFLSPTFAGKIETFAMIVPVPSRPTVAIQKGALFHDLAKLAFPTGIDPLELAAGASPTVLEKKVVGAYEVTVLSGGDSVGLMDWLKKNRYIVPPKAQEALRQYLADGFSFAVVNIKNPKVAKGLQSGTLAPLKLSFASEKPFLPMRFGAASGRDFNLLSYVMVPEAKVKPDAGAFAGLKIEVGPAPRLGKRSPARVTAKPGQKGYDTLKGVLGGQTLRLYVERTRLKPAECTDDYTWNWK